MELNISHSGDTPIYEQITCQIKGHILHGVLSTGDVLPSMRTLAKDLRISVITTKRAYEDLERDGFINTVPGKGCFVAPSNLGALREQAMRRMEKELAAVVKTAKTSAISLEEMTQALNLLYGGVPHE